MGYPTNMARQYGLSPMAAGAQLCCHLTQYHVTGIRRQITGESGKQPAYWMRGGGLGRAESPKRLLCPVSDGELTKRGLIRVL